MTAVWAALAVEMALSVLALLQWLPILLQHCITLHPTMLLSSADHIDMVATTVGAATLYSLPADDNDSKSCIQYCFHSCCALALLLCIIHCCSNGITAAMSIASLLSNEDHHCM